MDGDEIRCDSEVDSQSGNTGTFRDDNLTAKALAMYSPTLYHTRYVHMKLFWPYVFHSPSPFYRTFGSSDDRSTSFWLAAGS